MVGIGTGVRGLKLHNHGAVCQHRLTLTIQIHIRRKAEQLLTQTRGQEHLLPLRHAPVDAIIHQHVQS